MPPHFDGRATTAGLRTLSTRERVLALADPGSVQPVSRELDAPRPSPHLARWGIAAQDDDGVVAARATIEGAKVLIAAQDERFLGGSCGANHSDALRRLFETAAAERPSAVVLLAASGGVRLHEANAAEWELARALSALLDLRVAGIAVLCVGVADVFGGMSVLACAAERIALLPRVRLGLSGPVVIETTRGASELDAKDPAAIAAVFGAEARAAAGCAELVSDGAAAVRQWIVQRIAASEPFAACVRTLQLTLAQRLDLDANDDETLGMARGPSLLYPDLALLFANTSPVDETGWLARGGSESTWLCRPVGAGTFGPRAAHAQDEALLSHVLPAVASGAHGERVILVGDSRGHEVSRRAEVLCISQYLAQHAAVLALLRAKGVRLSGLLVGIGHSAEFFANVLQAQELHALAGTRVVAMEPAAIARVTRMPQADLLALIESDPLLGQPVRHFARFAGMDIVPDADPGRFGLDVEPPSA